MYQPSHKYENIKSRVSYQSQKLTRRSSEYQPSLLYATGRMIGYGTEAVPTNNDSNLLSLCHYVYYYYSVRFRTEHRTSTARLHLVLFSAALTHGKVLTPHSSGSNHKVGAYVHRRHSNFRSLNLKNLSGNRSSTQYTWPVMGCYDLAVATQMTLLFLPPIIFSRLKIVVDLLRRVLSNHERLASLMMNNLSSKDCERKSIDISMLDSPSTLEITMQAPPNTPPPPYIYFCTTGVEYNCASTFY
ncbi:unnamed protein product [Trichobilharzia regenti]|nr:unnamed protein product [Trichobilharzia regenti]